MVGTIIAGTAVAATVLTGYGMFNRRSAIFAPAIWRGPIDRPAIALTFDDGPSESTAEILDILQKHRITGTFFQCGANVRRLPASAREVCMAGHEVGNHTDTHPYLCFKSPGFIYHEMARAQEVIEQVTGVRPTVFRAPFGLRWYGMRRAQRRLGLTAVMWTAIGYDWTLAAERVIQVLLEQATNGAIFCLHDGRRTKPNPDIRATVGALAALIPRLLDRGFHFESLASMVRRQHSSATRL